MNILFFDIETYMDDARLWMSSRYNQNIQVINKMWTLASIAWIARQLDKDGVPISPDTKVEVHTASGNTRQERDLVAKSRELFHWADLIVAHNAKFDVGKIRWKFIQFDMKPPISYRVECTYHMSRKLGASSKKLNDLCKELGLSEKLPTQGIDTWMASESGGSEALAVMAKYNAHDVEMLRDLYDRIAHHCTREATPVITGIAGPHVSPITGVLGVRAFRALQKS